MRFCIFSIPLNIQLPKVDFSLVPRQANANCSPLAPADEHEESNVDKQSDGGIEEEELKKQLLKSMYLYGIQLSNRSVINH